MVLRSADNSNMEREWVVEYEHCPVGRNVPATVMPVHMNYSCQLM